MLPVVLALIFLAAFTLVAAAIQFALGGGDPVRRRLEELVQQRNVQPVAAPEVEDEEGRPRLTLRQVLTTAADQVLSRQAFARRIHTRLRRADWKLQVSEYLILQGVAAACGIAASLLLFRGKLWWVFAGLGFYLPLFLLNRRERARTCQFNDQLSDALVIIGNSLKSGYSFLQAMDVVSREMPEPIAREFGQVLKENRVGIPLEEALLGLGQRVPSEDLDLVITAVLIQRQVGGNLSEVLEKITETIKDRLRLLGEVRTLTAQGRMSGWIVSLLPVGLGGIIYLLNPRFISTLFTHPVGWVLLGVAGFMQLLGILTIRKLVNIEI